jgi:hypothetical protein
MVTCEVPPPVAEPVCVTAAERRVAVAVTIFVFAFFFGARLTAALPFFLLIGSPLLR